MDPERRMEMLQKRLNLSGDQAAQVKAIFEDGRSEDGGAAVEYGAGAAGPQVAR